MVAGLTFLGVCLLYAGALLVGWSLARRGRLDVTQLMRQRRPLADPLTRRFQDWGRRQKMDALRRKQWHRLRVLIWANNLAAVAFVGRTLYGATLVLAVYLTYRQGLGHGAAFAQPALRPRGAFLRVMMLEFGSYLVATALGVNLVVTPMTGGALSEAIRPLLSLYPAIAAALLTGAWLEVREIRSRMPAGVELPPGLEMEALRARALEMIARHSGTRE